MVIDGETKVHQELKAYADAGIKKTFFHVSIN